MRPVLDVLRALLHRERAQRVVLAAARVLVLRQRPRRLVGVRDAARAEADPQAVVVPDGPDAARGPAVVERPDELAVEAHVVRARLLRLEPGDVDEGEVMALDLERAVRAAADLDLAGRVRLDPDGRVLRADVAQERAEDEASHREALTNPVRGGPS